jgi:2-keto-4-pentenoate hydratase
MASVAHHKALAQELAAAYASRSPPAAPSERDPAFDLATAYAVESEFARMRRPGGRTTVGRKVGFANRAVLRLAARSRAALTIVSESAALTESRRGYPRKCGKSFSLPSTVPRR